MSQFPPTNQPGGVPSNPFGDANNPYSSPKSGQSPIPPGSVKNWLVESILALVCCCWPVAIVAIIYAVQVNSKLAAGDYQGAVEASNNAKMWVIIAVVLGVAGIVIGVGLQIIVAIAANQ
jgi:Interferon-induced transmembrane protein